MKINLNAILNYTGILFVLSGFFMLLGIPFTIYYGDSDLWVLTECGLAMIIMGFLFYVLTRKQREDIDKREGYIVVTTGWVALSLVGAIPFVLHGSIPAYTDAFFETMSGFSGTGSSILNDIESLPHGLLFWRSVTQWLGGMGMIVLSLAVLPLLGIGGMQLYTAESPGPTKDKLHPRISETAKRLWGIYLAFTLIETGFLYIGGMSFFDAVCHSFTTMATGGFSTKQASIAYWDSPFIQYVIIFFMFAASVNFAVHYKILHRDFKAPFKNDEVRLYTIFLAAVTIIVALVLYFNVEADAEKSFRDALFQVVSVASTTGFATADYEAWGGFLKLVFFLLLFSSGCAGSTSGGIKFVRHILLARNSLQELKRIIHPNAVIPVYYNKNAVPSDIMRNVLAFLLLYLVVFVVSSLIMTMVGLDFESAVGAVATCLGGIGPGIGTVGPMFNFASVPDLGKWVLSFVMILGRLELFTILIIFTPAFWEK